jgi:uncharacterized membrane protein
MFGFQNITKPITITFSALILCFIIFLSLSSTVAAQNKTTFVATGEIIQISEEKRNIGGVEREVSIIQVRINEDGQDKIIETTNFSRPEFQGVPFKAGDQILVNYNINPSTGEVIYTITDFVRTPSIFLLFFIFVAVTLLVTRRKGVFSLIGLVLSYFFIFQFLLQNIKIGVSPFILAIISAIVIIPINYYLAHGFTRKTSYAVLGTVVTLVFTGLMALLFVEWGRLTGFTTDEAGFISAVSNGKINLRELLLAGIIIGALGILDDITISQASIANQLKLAQPKISFTELFNRTMQVGGDHIASLVNTLILVYTGAAMPLLLLFVTSESSFIETINREVIAEEIIRTLVTSVGLIIAVPVTTLIACYFYSKSTNLQPEDDSHDHHHGHSHHGHTH